MYSFALFVLLSRNSGCVDANGGEKKSFKRFIYYFFFYGYYYAL